MMAFMCPESAFFSLESSSNNLIADLTSSERPANPPDLWIWSISLIIWSGKDKLTMAIFDTVEMINNRYKASNQLLLIQLLSRSSCAQTHQGLGEL